MNSIIFLIYLIRLLSAKIKIIYFHLTVQNIITSSYLLKKITITTSFGSVLDFFSDRKNINKEHLEISNIIRMN
jgi:hypothetical protein